MPEQDKPNAETAPAFDAAENATGAASHGEDTVIQVETLVADRDRLEREKGEMNDRLLRMAAEFDNFRKRCEREKAEIIEYGSENALKAMLPILDDFERAIKVETADAEYARGMSLIYQRMSEALTKLGLEAIDAEGKPFDPNLHYAIDRVEDPEVEQDTVISVYQRGYTLKGRLLRAAMVRVAVKG